MPVLILILTACQSSNVWRPDFSGDEPVAVVRYIRSQKEASRRAETAEDIKKLQDLVARIEADTSTLTEIGKDGSTYVGGGTDYRFERSAQCFLEIGWSEEGYAALLYAAAAAIVSFVKTRPQKRSSICFTARSKPSNKPTAQKDLSLVERSFLCRLGPLRLTSFKAPYILKR